jgi:hypothetical protein
MQMYCNRVMMQQNRLGSWLPWATRTGRCHLTLLSAQQVRLLLTQLGIPFERVEYDIDDCQTRTPAFLEKVNSNGRVPLVETEDGKRASGTIKFGPGILSRACSPA